MVPVGHGRVQLLAQTGTVRLVRIAQRVVARDVERLLVLVALVVHVLVRRIAVVALQLIVDRIATRSTASTAATESSSSSSSTDSSGPGTSNPIACSCSDCVLHILGFELVESFLIGL